MSEPSRFASRKLLVALLGMCMVTWLRSRGLLGDDAFATVMVAALVGYPAANIAQKYLDKP